MKNRDVLFAMLFCQSLFAVLTFLDLPTAAAGQSAPAFEVASVRPNDAGGNRIEVKPGQLIVTSATLATCIGWAYGVRGSQIAGANAAINGRLSSDRYDIVAKSARIVSEAELRLMLQTLLADRFQLTFHKQMREQHAFALVVEKNGPKFHESKGDGESKQLAKSRFARQWTATTMAQLTDVLSEAMEEPVVDQTGLAGRFDFSLNLEPYLPPAGERPDIAGMMTTAIREQLGLKVESRRATVDVMVVDSVDKPSAN